RWPRSPPRLRRRRPRRRGGGAEGRAFEAEHACRPPILGEFLPCWFGRYKSPLAVARGAGPGRTGGREESTGEGAEILALVPGCGMVGAMRALRMAAALLLAVVPLTASAQEAAEKEYQEARQALLDLIDDAKAKRYRDRWERVIAALDRSAARLRNEDLRCAALYNGARAVAEMAKVSFVQKDRDEADRRYRAVADRCPRSNLADDALYRAAEIHLGRDDARARATLDELL